VLHIKQERKRGEVKSNSLEHGESEANHDMGAESSTEGGHNTTSRRRIQATNEKNEKGHGPNKIKVLKNSVFIYVNEQLQPIGNSQRQMSSMIGCLARDPRRLPLDCIDWRKIEQEKKRFSVDRGEDIYVSIYITLLLKLNNYTLIFTPSLACVRVKSSTI